MISKKHILAICGSTRKQSVNKDIINAIAKFSGDTLNIAIYDGLTDLPYFNQDITDDHTPASVVAFREAIRKADGILICTPEYVFSLPGILKNALEWIVSTTLFSNKPTALITASSSGEKAHDSLLLVMKTLGIKTNNDLCLLISGVKSKLNKEGEVVNLQLEVRLKELVNTFVGVISKSEGF